MSGAIYRVEKKVNNKFLVLFILFVYYFFVGQPETNLVLHVQLVQIL